MKIAICDDLHLEFGDINITNDEKADVLILSGDIMIADDLHDHPEPMTPYTPEIIKLLGTRQANAQRYRDFLKRVSFQFPHVIYVAGNHEFYHGKWIQSLVTLRNECARFPNVHFLERDTVVIDGVRFIGGTMWTDCNKNDPLTLHALSDMMQDFKVIRHDGLGYTKLRPAHTLHRHIQTVDYFKHVLRDNLEQPTVITTHHAPSPLSVHVSYKDQVLMNGAYQSDLSELILDNPQIKLWTAGHMHHSYRYHIGDTLVACNPRGYIGYETCADNFRLKYVDLDDMPSGAEVTADYGWTKP